MVRAWELVNSGYRLNLAGIFNDKALEREVRSYPGWYRVNALGYLDRKRVVEILARSKIGLVTLHPLPNYVDALPVKMFEYMAARIPVIASSFPLWQEIVEGNGCGFCTDPRDPEAIAGTIERIMGNASLAEEMGTNGKRAVMSRYNWAVEEVKLLHLYEILFNRGGHRIFAPHGARRPIPEL